ncbi:protein PHLOEM PROTEIN 2-LIKE A9-like [Salvia miltiorrhiza]|uniref:protein PHLOEM PROTEIN 2-LIKE A9-like n=1 Tax=Salvia miltiorrhiza TaxID=226208 RepID=UPI0025AC4F86|nr:protein PHLOEM PROTEIN 2-LIKE A9-like [Salvia miltiorrhiza]
MASNSNTSPHHSGNSSAKFNKDERTKVILPKDLNIVWGNDTRYWNINDVAELHQVSWLEVTGGVEGASAAKSYEVGFSVSLNPDAFGWGKYPIYIMIKRGKEEKVTWTKISINPNNQETQFEIKGRLLKSDHSTDIGKLSFGLYEVWSGKWKGGLKIHKAFVNQL